MIINTEVSKPLARVGVYIILFVVFYILFFLIAPYFLVACSGTTHAIDAHVKSFNCFFDAGYVQQAKDTGYDHGAYFELFLPLDLVFPALYTAMFLTLLQLYKHRKIYKLLKWLVIVGCVFDYLENISFSIFLLLKTNSLAPLVAFFTTIKTIFFVLNIFIFLGGLLTALVLLFKTSKSAGRK